MAYKKRILIVNEASFLCTGFSNYGLEIMKRLHATGEYEIAELGTYVSPEDPRIQQVPWKFYAGQPSQQDKQGWEEYNKLSIQWGRQVNLGQFGDWALTRVLLDFKPDYVCNWMDSWMTSPVADSPLRKFFRWIYMPCIDSTPQREEWLRMFESADYLLGYSDFAINVMNEQSPKIHSLGAKKLLPIPARPGVDMNVFKPMNKDEVKEKWKLQKDLPIVLTCMRNQARKLFCEILDSFADFKNNNKGNKTADKAVLLIHSSGYDAGQEYWTHLLRLSTKKWMPHYCEGLLKHVLHTFICDGCGSKHIDYMIKLNDVVFENGRAYIPCVVCGQRKCRTPNTSLGYSREEMAEVFNLADLYVQCSIAGADEMPATEAKACGVPILASAYAALEEKTTKIKEKNADDSPYTMHLGGVPVRINHYFTEAATMQTRAYFDRKDLTKKLEILLDKSKLKKLSSEALYSIKENCDYDSIVKKWKYVFDNLPMKDRASTWFKPLNDADAPITSVNVPDGMSDEQFVDWCYTEILKTGVDAVGRQTWLENLSVGRPRREIVEYFASVKNKDKQAEMILMQYREQMEKIAKMQTVQTNPNLLKGILCQ